MTGRLFGQCRELLMKFRRILHRPGGSDALRRHLEAAETETKPAVMPLCCRECGSTDFEPVEARSVAAGMEAGGLRCRACGRLNSG